MEKNYNENLEDAKELLKSNYNKIIKPLEREENKLDLEIKKSNNIIKDLTGLNEDELNFIIRNVLKSLNQKIKWKKEELTIKNKIIGFLNKSLSKSPLIIDLPIDEFKYKYT